MNPTDKERIRTQIKTLKEKFSRDELVEKSHKIFQQIEALPQFLNAQTVLLYHSIDGEVYTHDFLNKWYNKKSILLPVVKGNNLDLARFTGIESIRVTPPFGIHEPINFITVPLQKVDIAIVPGVAFDEDGNRLGRGKGYYDRLFAESKTYKIGICFDFQLVKSVPTQSHDVTMDKIVLG
jgi:5-formyltetrahydrofolate cyclo-ligase